MKFENKGKWLTEAEDTLAAYDTQEHPDYLDGDNKVCTFEDDEITNFEEDDLDIVEEDDTLDSPEEEEDAIAMSEAWSDIYSVLAEIGQDWEFHKKKPNYTRDELKKATIDKLKAKGKSFNDRDLEEALNRWYDSANESSQKNEGRTIDDIPTRDLGKCLKAYKAKTKDLKLLNSTAIAKEFQKVFKLDYAPSILMVDKIIDNMPKEYTEAKLKSTLESSQKNEGPEEFKDNKYEKDFFEYKNGGHGSFMEYLAKACMQADKKNLAKIQKEFPELTKVFCLWKSSGRTDKAEKL